MNNEVMDEGLDVGEGGKKSSLKLFGALICLCLIVSTWIAMAFLIQAVQEGGSHYTKPFFLSYIVHSSYTIFVPSLVWRHKQVQRRKILPGTLKRTVLMCVGVMILYFIVAYTWYLSLSGTSVSANTVIYNSASVFVFLFSWIFLNESISLLKVVSIILSLVGVIIVSVLSYENRSDSVKETVAGYVCVVISTIVFALYEVLYKRFLKHENSLVVLGLVGAFNTVFLWPGIFILNALNVEEYRSPNDKTLIIIIITCVLDCLNNAFLLVGIRLSTPLFISVGSMLTIPIAVLIDVLLYGYTMPPWAFVGVFMVISGFVIINWVYYPGRNSSRKDYVELD